MLVEWDGVVAVADLQGSVGLNYIGDSRREIDDRTYLAGALHRTPAARLIRVP